MTTITDNPTENRLYRYALWLAIFTILYNLLEGLVWIYFGGYDETLTLFGIGLGSFIEVIFGIGILIMVLRIHQNPEIPPTRFEHTALRVTGMSFYLLATGLFVTAAYNYHIGHKPTATLSGSMVISLISIAAMWAGGGKKQSWAGTQLSSNTVRCELYDGLHLFVSGSFDGELNVSSIGFRDCK